MDAPIAMAPMGGILDSFQDLFIRGLGNLRRIERNAADPVLTVAIHLQKPEFDVLELTVDVVENVEYTPSFSACEFPLLGETGGYRTGPLGGGHVVHPEDGVLELRGDKRFPHGNHLLSGGV